MSTPLGVGVVQSQDEPVGTVLWERDLDGQLIAHVRLTSPEAE